MNDAELISELEAQRSLMVAVATGGPKIAGVNGQYTERRDRIAEELRARQIDDPNPHIDLWAWYGRWSAGDMASWYARRNYLTNLFQPLIDHIRAATGARAAVFEEPTGWPRVDRGVEGIRRALAQAGTEEQFQAVGLLCREALISVAQVVFDPLRHLSEDGTEISETDAKRMLDSYFAAELAGGPNEGVRRHAKAALASANELQHHRTANRREAALCAEATTSVVNIVAVVSGRRDQ